MKALRRPSAPKTPASASGPPSAGRTPPAPPRGPCSPRPRRGGRRRGRGRGCGRSRSRWPHQILKSFRFASVENLKANLQLFDETLRRAIEEEERLENLAAITRLDSRKIEDAFAGPRKEGGAAKAEHSQENLRLLQALAQRF